MFLKMGGSISRIEVIAIDMENEKAAKKMFESAGIYTSTFQPVRYDST